MKHGRVNLWLAPTARWGLMVDAGETEPSAVMWEKTASNWTPFSMRKGTTGQLQGAAGTGYLHVMRDDGESRSTARLNW